MEFFIVAKQKRGFVLLADSMACAIESGGTSLCRREIYDVAIIVSGDQDYVPAVEIVKDSGKEVYNVFSRK